MLSQDLERILNKKVFIDGGDPETVEYVNLKHNSKAEAAELCLPVPQGETVRLSVDKNGRPNDLHKLEEIIRKTFRITGKVIVKGTYGSSGSSIEIIPDDGGPLREALERISKRNDNHIYLVEPMLEIVNSTNIIFHVERDGGRLRCVSATDQVLNEKLEYKGSIFPPNAQTIEDMIRSGEKLAGWLQSKRYIGLVGFDFGEYIDSNDGKTKYFFAEINPRVNASAYPKALMENLNLEQKKHRNPEIEAFLSVKVETDIESFVMLREKIGPYFFCPETGKGLVPYNIGRLENGMFNAIFLGKSISEVSSMHGLLKTQMHQS